MIKALRTLIPGDPGTKKAMHKYGDKLICVRYRIDPQTLKKYKTVEIIEEEIKKNSNKKRIPMNKIIDLKIHVKEIHLRNIIKSVGGKWNPQKQTWRLPYSEIKNLGLEKRIVLNNVEK